jgi:hypothetical protein
MLAVWSNAQVGALKRFLGADDGAQGCVVGLRPALQGAIPQHPQTARALTDIISTLSKHSTHRTQLSAVRSMTRDD